MLKKLLLMLGIRKAKPQRRPNPFAIVVGEVDDPDLRRIAKPRLRYPRKRGRSEEEFQADLEAFKQDLREKSEASFRLTRRRAVEIGSTHYIWRTAKSSDVCLVCRPREGKKFKWEIEPENGHAGCVTCCPQGWCMCYAEPVFDV